MFNTYADEITEKHRDRYIWETKILFSQRVRVVLFLSIILVPTFLFMDILLVPEFFNSFLLYRTTCTFILIGLLCITFFESGKKHPKLIVLILNLVISGTLSTMIVTMGGYTSSYFIGIILLLVASSAIIPFTTTQSAFMAFILYLIYVVPVIMFNHPTDQFLRVFYGNNFFFLSYMLVTVLQCREETKVRIRKFNLKMQLEYYNKYLEVEVGRRAKDLEDSEIKYRVLYENIIDVVVMVNRNGSIIKANPCFYKTLGIHEEDKIAFSLKHFIYPKDIPVFDEYLLRLINNEKDVDCFEFRIVSMTCGVIHVECNARSIYNKDSFVGCQMVMRDVTERKRLETNLQETYSNLETARESAILGLAKLAEFRDQSTGLHLERIREYSKLIAKELSKMAKYQDYITDDYINDLYMSSILHDIGKVGIPDAILHKPGKLSREEFEQMKRHTQIGGDAINSVEAKIGGTSFLTLGKTIAYYHHEKWDGTGYPKGLSGEGIPLSTRIIALADIYDALTSKRVYKNAYTHEKANEIILGQSGTHFDPNIIDAFVVNQDAFNTIREKMLHGGSRHLYA